jgi:hypothetical protein
MKSFRYCLLVLSLGTLSLLSGCSEVALSNLTDRQIPQNPSGLYTITVEVDAPNRPTVQNSLAVDIVIDGETHAMKRVDPKANYFEYDYRMPKGRNHAKYYLIMRYNERTSGEVKPVSKMSELYHLSLMNRYVVSLESQRGLIGSTIGVMGRGFTPKDRIFFNHTEAETQFFSSNALAFKVPALPANTTYEVVLKTINVELPMGTFRIDPAPMKVQPNRILVNSGDRSFILVSIETEAPASGVALDITTDVPDSLIMPASMNIPSGAYTASIPFEGGAPGRGHLFIEANGFESAQVPLEVIDTKGFYPSDPLDIPMGEETLAPVDADFVSDPVAPMSWSPVDDTTGL